MNGKRVKRFVQALLLGILLLNVAVKDVQARGQEQLLNGDPREQILQATVQLSASITLSKPVGTNRVKETSMTGHGLGSLIRKDGRVFIVTHNHWGEPLQNESLVEFRDAKQNLLLTLSGAQFKDLIHYKDAGTLILNAPEELFASRERQRALAPAQLAFEKKNDAFTIKPGDVVQVAYRPADNFQQVELLEAKIESISKFKGVPTLNLRSLNGQAVAPGDSGGGIWFQGRLVANLWGRLLLERAAKNGSSNQTQLVETDLYYSAVFPTSR